VGGREAELAARFLLQCRGGEGGLRIAPRRLGLDGRNRKRRGLDRLLEVLGLGAGADPDRKLNKRSTYAGVVDTGPVAGETFEQKVARLKAVSAAAKQRAEADGDQTAPPDVIDTPLVGAVLESAMTPPEADPSAAAAPSSSPAATHKPTGEADRTLMIRSTYCGVVDTGPAPGEIFPTGPAGNHDPAL